jgi:hypothetical protein
MLRARLEVLAVATTKIADAGSALTSLRHVNVGSVVDTSEVSAAFIFKVKVSRVDWCLRIYRV